MLRGKKKLLIISTALASVLVFSAFAILIVNLFDLNNKSHNQINETISAVVTSNECNYVFDEISDYLDDTYDAYKNNTVFGIKNIEGLLAFSRSVWKACHFESKKVYILKDIDATDIADEGAFEDSSKINFIPIGADMWIDDDDIVNTYYDDFEGEGSFKGLFDGQNYTISNLKTRITDRGVDEIRLGFFSEIQCGATIQNVRINNFTITGYNHDEDANTKIGGLAGFVDLDFGPSYTLNVKNCLVKNLKINIYEDDTIAGGLFGMVEIEHNSKLNIEECAVDGFTVYVDYAACKENADAIGGLIAESYVYELSNVLGELKILNCLVKDFTITSDKNLTAVYVASLAPACGTIFDHGDLQDGIFNKTYSNTYFAYDISKCVVQNCGTYKVSNAGTEGSYLGTMTNIITSENTTTGLGCNSTGGANLSVWYYAKDYNNGYPYLRRYLSWSTVSFAKTTNPTNENGGSITGTSLQIPTNYFTQVNASKANTFISGCYVAILNQSVEAIPNTGYGCTWSVVVGSGTITYTATFEKVPYQINFVSSITGVTISGAGMYEVYINTTITIEILAWSGNSSAYRVVLYKFKDKNNRDITVTYTANDTYYISEYGLNGVSTIRQEYIGEHSIRVAAVLKTYDPVFS